MFYLVLNIVVFIYVGACILETNICVSAPLSAPTKDSNADINQTTVLPGNLTEDMYMNDGFGRRRDGGYNSGFRLGDVPSSLSSSGRSAPDNVRHHHGGGRRVKMSCEPTPPSTLKRWLGPAFNARYMSAEKPNELKPHASIGASLWGQADNAPLDFENIEDDQSEEYKPWELEEREPEAPDYQQDSPAPSAGADLDHEQFAVDKNYQRDLPAETEFALVDLNDDEWVIENAGRLEPSPQRAKRALGTIFTTFKEKKPLHTRTSLLKKSSPFARKKTDSLSSGKKKDRLGRKKTALSKNPKSNLEPWQCQQSIRWIDLGQDHYPRYVRAVSCGATNCWNGLYGCREKSFTIKVLRRVSDECMPVYSRSSLKSGTPVPTRYVQEWIFEERALPFCCECARL